MKNKKAFLLFFLLVCLYILLSFLHLSFATLMFNKNQRVFSIELLPLRYMTSFVFLWYGLGHLASGLEFNGICNRCLQKFGIMKNYDYTTFAKFWGILELFIAISFIFGFYLDISSLLASAILFGIILVYYIGANSFIFRDVAIFGGTLSLFLLTR